MHMFAGEQMVAGEQISRWANPSDDKMSDELMSDDQMFGFK